MRTSTWVGCQYSSKVVTVPLEGHYMSFSILKKARKQEFISRKIFGGRITIMFSFSKPFRVVMVKVFLSRLFLVFLPA